MLAIFQRYVEPIRAARTSSDIASILSDLVDFFGYRSAFIVEYGDDFSHAINVIDTDPERAGWWNEHFNGESRLIDGAIEQRMIDEGVLHLGREQFAHRPPQMEAFARKRDMVDVLVIPMSLNGQVVANVTFCGTPVPSATDEKALQLISYALYTQTRLIRRRDPHDNAPTLTAREREVIALTADGLTSQQIADRLGISARTANQHIDNVALKLGTRNRTQTVAEVIRRNLMS